MKNDKTIDYVNEVAKFEAELSNLIGLYETVGEEIQIQLEKLNSKLITPETTGENKIKLQRSYHENVDFRNTLAADIQVRQKYIAEYKNAVQSWDDKISQVYRQMNEGGVNDLILKSSLIMNPSKELKTAIETVKNNQNDKSLSKEKRVMSYLFTKNLLEQEKK